MNWAETTSFSKNPKQVIRCLETAGACQVNKPTSPTKVTLTTAPTKLSDCKRKFSSKALETPRGIRGVLFFETIVFRVPLVKASIAGALYFVGNSKLKLVNTTDG